MTNTKVLYVQGDADSSSTVAAGASTYYCLGGTGSLGTGFAAASEARAQVLQKNAGDFSNLSVNIVTNGIAATSTYTFRVNGADGNMIISVPANTTGIFDETAQSGTRHTDSVVSGDKTDLEVTAGGASGTIAIMLGSVAFRNTSSTDTIARLCNTYYTTSITAASTTYYEPVGGEQPTTLGSTENNAKCRFRKAGTIKNAGVYVRTNGRSTNTTLTLRQNGANTSLVITVPGDGTTGWVEDTNAAHAVSVAAGDDLDWAITTGTGTGTFAIDNICADYINSSGWFPIILATTDAVAQGDNQIRYTTLGGYYYVNATMGNNDNLACVSYTFAELAVWVVANDVSSASNVTLMVGAENSETASALVASITGNTSGQAFVDSTHTVTVNATDCLVYRITVPSVSGSHSVTIKSIVMWGQDQSTYGNNVVRSLATETISISEQSFTLLRNKIRTGGAQTITVSEPNPPARLSAKLRPITTQTITVSEPSPPVRQKSKTRGPSTESVSISEQSLTQVRNKIRTLASQTVSISEQSFTRLLEKIRPLAAETITIPAGTLARLKAAKRTSTDTTATSETLDRLKKAIRALSTETVVVSAGTLTRIKSAIKAFTESVTILAGTLARLSAKVRVFTETITVPAETLTILREKIRTATDTTAISEAVDRTKIVGAIHINKTLTETAITVSDGLVRLLSKIRTATDTIDVTTTLARKLELTRILSETVNKAETLARKSAKVRVSTDTTAISSSLITLLAKIRTATDTTVISDAVDRVTSVASLNVVKSITESVITITDGLTKLLAKIRTVTETDTVPITTSLSRRTSKIRTLSDTVSKSETLTRISAKVKALATETVSSSESISRLLAKIRARTETITISELVNRLVQGPAKHLVRIIEELDIAVSDYFYKSRVLDTETIEVTDFVEITVIQPINNIIEIIEEPISIADNVTFVAPIKEVMMTLIESTDIGEANSKISGKVRRIGGPG